MTDRPKTPADDALEEMIASLARPPGRSLQESADSDGTNISDRLETLMGPLGEAVLGEWPTVEELRQLPPPDYATLVRQLGVFIDHLSSLRLELLRGRGPRLV